MASLNKCLLIGNAGKDPEVRYTANGTAVASFSLATTEKIKNSKGEWEDKVEWHNITLWAKLAEVASEYLTKGKSVYIEGRLQTRKWQDKDGNTRYTTEIVGEKMQFLGGKGDKSSTGNNTNSAGGSGHAEPPFNPEDDCPF